MSRYNKEFLIKISINAESVASEVANLIRDFFVENAVHIGRINQLIKDKFFEAKKSHP